MKQQIIAIDCDDVLVPTASLILAHYNKTYGTNVALKDLYSSDFSVWGVPDMTTAVQRIEAYNKTAEYQLAKPFEKAIEVIHELSKYHEIHLVTGRPDFLAVVTKKMLTQYFPNLFSSLEFTNFFGKQERSKAEVCQFLNADYLIEDHLHHAEVVSKCGTNVLLFGNYPWNQTDTLPPNVRRVNDWNEVGRILLEH